MLRRFYLWLEQGAYHAICRGCQKAVADLSGGQVVLDIESTPLLEEDKVADSPPGPAKRTVQKKRATRK